MWNKSETKKKISVDNKLWVMISHGVMQLIRYSNWPESDLGAEDTMGTYSMGTGVLVSVEGCPVWRLPLKDRRKSYKQINWSYKSLAKLVLNLQQCNFPKKWNEMFLTSSRKIELIDPILKTKKKIHYWYTRTSQRKLKGFDISQCQKRYTKFDDFKSFQTCSKVL